jgi:hypothetical protein
MTVDALLYTAVTLAVLCHKRRPQPSIAVLLPDIARPCPHPWCEFHVAPRGATH